VPAAAGRQLLGGEQAGVLGGEPRQRGFFVRQGIRLDLDRLPMRIEQPVAAARGADVGVDQPAQGEVIGAGPVGGVQADQVVQPPAVGCVLVQKRNPLQGAENGPDSGRRKAGERGRGGQADVGAGGQSQQPEHLRLIRRQRDVRAGQHRGQAGGRVGVVEGVQTGLT